MNYKELSELLNLIYSPDRFKDYCINGLNIDSCPQKDGNSQKKIQRVATGVSLSLDLMQEAVSWQADALVVHHPHGLWNNQPRMPTGALAALYQKVYQHQISVYAYHLPMDGQPELGNNAQIAQQMGIQPESGLMQAGEGYVGLLGRTPTPTNLANLVQKLQNLLPPEPPLRIFAYGPQTVQKIAICSGGGASGLEEAASLGADVYLTGEVKESTPMEAKYLGIHLIVAGHHNTETFGPRALADHLQAHHKLQTRFINIPNSI